MGNVLADIHEAIQKTGPITVAEYMEIALQHPEFGYYRNNDPIGLKGDFITAPEISQMFGEMIGLWSADVWHQFNKPKKFTLLELGPGHGTLMQDALRATRKIDGFHQAMSLCLMESNLKLRRIQHEALQKHQPKFLETLLELPPEPVIVIANEFFDALPIRQFEKTFQGWCERLIKIEGDRLAFTSWPLNDELLNLIPFDLRQSPPGTIYEISLPSLSIIKQIARHFIQHGGAMLIIDYGYVQPVGKATLQAVSSHAYAHILERPGEVDLTAHVDFSALASLARKEGLLSTEILAQGEFLCALGIEIRAAHLKQHATPEQARAIDAALSRLTSTEEMGTLFKAMGLLASTKGLADSILPSHQRLPGF